MDSTFGIIALASSIFLAIACLCLVGLNYDDLFAADERSILYAAAAGKEVVNLASTEVVRGYLMACFLLLFAALASSFAHIVSTTYPRGTKANKFHRFLRRITLMGVLLAFGSGICLTTLSASSLLENETPRWCVPGSAIKGNLINHASPLLVPIDYVYDDVLESSSALQGDEVQWENLNLPSETFRGEFKRHPLIDSSGRHCFAVNESITQFWREAMWKYAIPVAMILSCLMMIASCFDTIDHDEVDRQQHRRHYGHHLNYGGVGGSSSTGHRNLYESSLPTSSGVYHCSAGGDDDDDDKLINPLYECDVPILKFLKVAKLSKKARASIILGGMTEGKRPPLRTVYV
jgi:hypothetical protein